MLTKLIRFIAFSVAMASFWSVYSKPEVRQALLMAIEMESEDFESDYDDDVSDSDDEYDNGYAYDDYDSD